jgi:putative hydroxymethylpyrimidine transport system substrate-binding protein
MPDVTSVRLLLDWTLDAKHAVFVEGIEKGFFAEQGIDLSILEPASKSSLALELLFKGEADIAINYPHNIILLQRDYPGIVSIGTLVRRNPEGLLSLSRAGIGKPADLRGKRIGVGPSPVSRAQLEVFLSENCVPEDSVRLVVVGFEGESLLLQGEIDALDAVSYAIPRTVRKGHAVNFLPYTEYGIPDSPFLVFAVRSSWLDSNREAARSFLAASRRGLDSVLGWSADDWKKYAGRLSVGKTAEEEAEVWRRTYALMDPDDPFGLDLRQIGALCAILRGKGILRKEYDLAALFPGVL